MSFTLLFVRTDPTANGRQITLVVDDVHGIAEVTHRQLVNPVRNIMTYRTSFLALRHFAMQAAFSLVDSLKHGVALVNFLK